MIKRAVIITAVAVCLLGIAVMRLQNHVLALDGKLSTLNNPETKKEERQRVPAEQSTSPPVYTKAQVAGRPVYPKSASAAEGLVDRGTIDQ